MKKILVLAAMLLLVVSTAMATPISLVGYDPNGDGRLSYAELVALTDAGNVGILDDKVFSNFEYSSSAYPTEPPELAVTPIPAGGITVTLITEEFNPGFQFQAGWSVGPGQGMDSLITFDVQVLPGGNPIENIYAFMGGFGWSTSGSVSVSETTNVGTIFLTANAGGVTNEETITFDPTTGIIHVSKDIAVNGNGGSAAVSQVIDQFSEVPEPATMLLFGSGLIGLAGYARRRFHKK